MGQGESPYDWRAKDSGDQKVTAIKRQYSEMVRLETWLTPLDHEHRIGYIRKLPVGAFVNLPEFWQTVNNLDTVIDALYYVGEPLNSDELSALSRCSRINSRSSSIIMAAALLYRYGNAIGEEILKERFTKLHDSNAAIILAMNHDYSLLPEMLQLLQIGPVPNPSLLYALSDCNLPACNKLIYDLYIRDTGNIDLAVGLGRHRVLQAEPLLSQTYLDLSDVDSNKLYFAAALAKLDPKGQPGALELIRNAITSQDTSRAWVAIDAVTRTSDSQFSAEINERTVRFLLRTDKGLNMSTPTSSAEYAVVQACALSLLRTTGVQYLAAIDKVVALPDFGYETQVNTADICRAILRVNPDDETVRRRFGEEWRSREVAKLSLRKVTDNYLLDKIQIVEAPALP
jgi:hypothetical protein